MQRVARRFLSSPARVVHEEGARRRLASALPVLRDSFSCEACSREDEVWREQVDAMIVTHIRPDPDSGTSHPWTDTYFRSVLDTCLLSSEVDTQYGGSRSTFTRSVIFLEELAKATFRPDLLSLSLVPSLIQRYGTEEQKDAFLPRLARGEVGTYTESSSTSKSHVDLTSTSQGDLYHLTGGDDMVLNAEAAGIFLVMTNRKATHVREIHQEIKPVDCFIVEKSDGLVAGPSTCYEAGPIHLNNVQVPQSRLLGENLRGSMEAMDVRAEKNIRLAAMASGISRGYLNRALHYIKVTEDHSEMINTAGSLRAEIESARLMTYSAAKRRDLGLEHKFHAKMAASLAINVTRSTVDKCQRWMPFSEMDVLSRSCWILKLLENI